MASVISMKALLESGVHFGHRTNKWDPHMRPFIFTERNGIHILDLQQTVKAITTSYNLVRDTVAKGGTVLFVGTKRQAQETVKEEATRCGMPYVTERWLGGTLTNWTTISQRLGELERLERLKETGEINNYTKKEALMIERNINRLLIRLSGVRNMKKTPDLLFIVDVSREETAVHEANLKDIPVIAMVDTNCDPTNIDYVIPSNDDAIRAIKLMVAKIADAVLEGRAIRKDDGEEDVDFTDFEGKPAARPRMDEDAELDDETLLGASTLAKLEADKPDEVAAEAVEEFKAGEEETEEIVAETEDTVEPAVETVETVEPAVETVETVEPAVETVETVEETVETVEEAKEVVEEETAVKKPAKKAAKKAPKKAAEVKEDAEETEE